MLQIRAEKIAYLPNNVLLKKLIQRNRATLSHPWPEKILLSVVRGPKMISKTSYLFQQPFLGMCFAEIHQSYLVFVVERHLF